MFARPTQPSITLGSVNEYQLWLGRLRQVWFISLADERGVCRWDLWGEVRKLWDPLRMHAIPERLRGVIMTRRYTNPRLPLPDLTLHVELMSLSTAVAEYDVFSDSFVFWTLLHWSGLSVEQIQLIGSVNHEDGWKCIQPEVHPVQTHRCYCAKQHSLMNRRVKWITLEVVYLYAL